MILDLSSGKWLSNPPPARAQVVKRRKKRKWKTKWGRRNEKELKK